MIEGNLPGGAKDSVVLKVASIVSFLIMKAIVLDDRLKEKDAYDIYYCFKQYSDKLDDLVAAFEEVTDEEDRTLMERDAFERVNYLLQKLGIV